MARVIKEDVAIRWSGGKVCCFGEIQEREKVCFYGLGFICEAQLDAEDLVGGGTRAREMNS